MNDTELRLKFAEGAKAWAEAKVHYLHRGFSFRGCDCGGLVVGIAKQLGLIDNYKMRMYPRDWNLHSGAGNYIVEEIEKIANKIPNSEIDVGDIPIFRFGKCIAHVGVLLNKSTMCFAHSHRIAGHCWYAVLRNSNWSKRWVETYRLSNEKMVLYK